MPCGGRNWPRINGLTGICWAARGRCISVTALDGTLYRSGLRLHFTVQQEPHPSMAFPGSTPPGKPSKPGQPDIHSEGLGQEVWSLAARLSRSLELVVSTIATTGKPSPELSSPPSQPECPSAVAVGEVSPADQRSRLTAAWTSRHAVYGWRSTGRIRFWRATAGQLGVVQKSYRSIRQSSSSSDVMMRVTGSSEKTSVTHM